MVPPKTSPNTEYSLLGPSFSSYSGEPEVSTMTAIVTGAMSTLLPKLGELLKEEYQLQKRARGEVMFLKAELESMQAALLKVSEAPIDQPLDIQVKLWARDVRDLSYDIEDTIDTFMVRVDARMPSDNQHSFRGFIDRSLSLMKKADIRRKIGLDIKDMRSRIKEVSDRRDRYKVDNVAANRRVGPTVDSLRLSALYRRAKELVGTDEKSDDLVKRLMHGEESSKEQLKVVSIVGVGGLGKTTLANVVYRKLKKKYDCAAFVSVSLTPNMDKIFKDILQQLEERKYSEIKMATWGEAQLIEEMREFLRNKRYLIVVDDIWDKSVWEKMMYCLPEDEYRSGLITTTRILDVAKHVGGVYQLEPLSLDDSRKLFFLRIFGVEDKCPIQLAEVSENILKKCGGVPLAIITIASVLASKTGNANAYRYWSKVYQSMGSGIGDSPHIQDMRRMLSISYYDLLPHLRTCLLYISLYPEDYKINREVLIWKWIGGGFVHQKQGMTLHEVGEEYFDELINKSLIQPIDINGDNKSNYCRVHDMVLDLILSLSNEECFLTTLGYQQPMPTQGKVRRLSIQNSNHDVVQLSAMTSHLRSLIVFNEAFNSLPALLSFPVLRVLDLSFCEQVDNHHFKDICSMFHLRYLSLHGTSVTKIPREIKNLQFLQVLYISDTKIKVLPSTFVQLQQLIYLRVSSQVRLPNGFGNLKSLQEVEGTIIIDCPNLLHDLARLTELRRLNIEFKECGICYVKPFQQCLANLINLYYLRIACCHDILLHYLLCEKLSPRPQQLSVVVMQCNIIHAVPKWMASLLFLSSLLIKLETLGEKDLRVLGSVPSLSHLYIEVEEPTWDRYERLVIDNRYPFRCLTFLRLWSDAMEVVFARGAMQKLQTLSFVFNVRKTMDIFNDMDFGLENLSSLEHAQVNLWDQCSNEELEAAEMAVHKAIDMNPKKPKLTFMKVKYSEPQHLSKGVKDGACVHTCGSDIKMQKERPDMLGASTISLYILPKKCHIGLSNDVKEKKKKREHEPPLIKERQPLCKLQEKCID